VKIGSRYHLRHPCVWHVFTLKWDRAETKWITLNWISTWLSTYLFCSWLWVVGFLDSRQFKWRWGNKKNAKWLLVILKGK
jgi:hypothetical protein